MTAAVYFFKVQSMTRFNPDFWEVRVSQESLQRFSTEDHPYYEDPREAEARQEREEQARAILPQIRALMAEVLTPRQCEVVSLYFLEGLNQREIAERLGISQQSVCEHLYGKVRNGRAVGGAMQKLRKACARQNVRWGVSP